ncbi:MAG: monothiol glutaredoxin grx4 [Watsoniomyces obsoletus]|nr:MAG: monothiol glutaredoxin grx4 [Watsoniomyces obsoletus]
MTVSQRFRKALALLLALICISIGVRYGVGGRHQEHRMSFPPAPLRAVAWTESARWGRIGSFVGAVKSALDQPNPDATRDDGERAASPPPIEAVTDFGSRLWRRAKSIRGRGAPNELADFFRARGEPDEFLELLSKVQATHSDYQGKTRQNREAKAAGLPPPWSKDVLQKLNPEVTIYQRMRRYATAIKSGDRQRIETARDILQWDYESRVYTDDELRRALTDEEVKRFKEVRSLHLEWAAVKKEADEAGQPLRRQPLTPQLRQLDVASYEYQRFLQRLNVVFNKPGTPRAPFNPGTRMYKDEKVKSLLPLDEVAKFFKGRRLATEYNRRRIEADKRKVPIRDVPPDVTSKDTYEELTSGRQLYREMLEKLKKLEKAAAERGQPTAGEGRSYGLKDKNVPRLFTPEEERMAKEFLDLPEIEELMDGKWAERDLQEAQARSEAARREGRRPLVSQKELNDWQSKIDRSEELKRTMEERERHARSIQGGPVPGASSVTPKGKKKGTATGPPGDGPSPPPPLTPPAAAGPPAIQQQRETVIVRKLIKQASAKEGQGQGPPVLHPKPNRPDIPQGQPVSEPEPEPISADNPQSRPVSKPKPVLKSKPTRPDNPLQFLANPSSLGSQVRAGWEQLGRQWQGVPKTLASQVAGGAQQIGPWVGSLARTRPPIQVPGGFKGPLPI